jgi:hypothetical protein
MKEPISPESLYRLLQMPKGVAKTAEAINLFGIRGVDVLTLLEMRSGWHNVGEGLPDQVGRYLVARSNEYPEVDVEIFYNGGFYDDGEQDTNVTHWKEIVLPEVRSDV